LKAEELGLVGWVRNCSDGTVETLISGDAASIDTMIDWLHHGPPSASVTSLDTAAAVDDGSLSGFAITY
jgi:acylphosphatase